MVSAWRACAAVALMALACSRPAPAASAPQASHPLDPISLTPWPAELKELRVGLTPYMDRPVMLDTFGPLVEYLSQRLGVPTSIVSTKDYSDLGQKMLAQEVDIGVFSPLAYVEAKEADPGLRLLLKQVAEGSPSFLGYIVTLEGNRAESIKDLAGQSMCFVDLHSTSGYLYPQALLRGQGLDPRTLFSRTVFAGNHLDCLRKLLDGEVDAASVYSGAIASARRDGLPVNRLKVLAKTPPIPYDAYCVRSKLPEAAAERVKQELLLLSTASPGGRKVLGQKVRLNAWTEAADSEYDSVRRVRALVKQESAARP